MYKKYYSLNDLVLEGRLQFCIIWEEQNYRTNAYDTSCAIVHRTEAQIIVHVR